MNAMIKISFFFFLNIILSAQFAFAIRDGIEVQSAKFERVVEISSSCSGYMLTERVLLTAGHCGDLIKKKRVTIGRFGKHRDSIRSTREFDYYQEEFGSENYRVVDARIIFKKKEFNEPCMVWGIQIPRCEISTEVYSDIGLIWLRKPVHLETTVAPLFTGELKNDDLLYHYGWGMDPGKESSKLKYTTLNFDSFVHAEGIRSGNFALPKEGQGIPCGGDSGGPIFIKDPDTTELHLAMLGTYSTTGRYIEDQKKACLNPNNYGGGIFVNDYLPWIQETYLAWKNGHRYEHLVKPHLRVDLYDDNPY